MPGELELGIVIPTLNEATHVPLLLGDLASLPVPCRIVVADGGSVDGTQEIARDLGAEVLEAPRGRARQMNAGADHLSTPWLLFLHADVRLPTDTLAELARWLRLAASDHVGTFAFALDGHHWFWRFIELGQRLRERISGLAYGDQGLLVSSSLFHGAGGFPDIPLMEDVAFLRLLKRYGTWRPIPARALSSPRRYREEGRWRGWLRNSALLTLYLAGVPPHRLARFYPPRPARARSSGIASRTVPGTSPRAHRALVVFAKEPAPGKVKTRLARDVGAREAARIYERLAKAVVDNVRGGAYRTIVCFDPPTAAKEIETWLGGDRLEFRPQGTGDLGDRLTLAFLEAFSSARRVVAIGTDAPDVDAHLVEEAFSLLETADLVLGPARDGGYYLIGLRTPRPELFRDIPWSTERVLHATLARARALGLREALLPVRSDIDTLDDWREHAPRG